MSRLLKRSLALLVVFTLLLSILSFITPSAFAQTNKITIMATSDEHGNIYPIDYYTLKPADRGLAKIYTLVKQVRSENPNSLLISNGDAIQGTPLVYYYTKIDTTKTHPMMAVMNYMGYDAMVVGNHEIQDYGWDWLQNVAEDAEFPILSANLVEKDTGKSAMTPYVIKEVGGVKVGIIGLTTSESNTVTPPYNLAGHWFEDAVETAGKYIKELRPQVDILIVSAHMGFEWGNDTKTFKYLTPVREGNVADAIVMKYPEIDVLITGHDHYNIAPFVRNGVLCVQPTNWGQGLAKMDITLEKDGSKWKVVKKEGVTLAVDSKVEASSEILDIAKPYHDTTVSYVDSVIGEALGDIDGTTCRVEDNAMLDLIHGVQLEMTGADISIAAMLPTVAPVWKKGPIRVRDVYSLYIYDNTLWMEEVTGKDVKEALENSYRYYNVYDFGATDTPLVNPNIRAYNFDTVQGLEYVIDISKPIGQRVVSLTYKGSPVTPTQKFKLAVNNYRGNGGGGYTMFSSKKATWMSVDEIRNYMIDYIKKKGAISPEPDNNWKLLPDYLSSPLKGDIDTLFRRGVLKDLGIEGFMPDSTVTRGDFVFLAARSFIYEVMPYKAAKYSFYDVTSGNPSAPYIEGLYRAGIVKGYGDGTFRPDQAITKEEAATIFLRLVKMDQGSLYGNFMKIEELKAFSVNSNPKESMKKVEVAKLLVDLRFPVITILHTNDFHMYLIDTATKKNISAKIATIIKQEEAANSRTLVVDAGDAIGGGPPIGAFFYGKDVIETYNAIGYDIATFGNHEFDWGKELLKERIAEAKYKYICANVIDTTTNSTFAKSGYTVKNFGFLDLGFIGVDTTDLPTLVNPTGIEGLRVTDPAEATNSAVSAMKDISDYNIVLSHLGYDFDKTFAAKISGVGLIIGGHSHTKLDVPTDVKGVKIVQTGNYGANVGKVVLEFVASPTGAKLVNMNYKLIPVADSIADNPEIKALLDPYNTELAKKMDVVIGEALVELDGLRANVRSKETNLGDYITDWMRAVSGADIAITNGGGIRASIPKGPITVGTIYTIVPFDNILAVVEITGKQVLQALENGYSLIEKGDGRFAQISGIKVKVDRKKPAGSRVVEVTLLDGTPLDSDKMYKVAVLDFMVNGGDGYTALKPYKSFKWITGNWVRDDLVEYVKAHPQVTATVDGRITFVDTP